MNQKKAVARIIPENAIAIRSNPIILSKYGMDICIFHSGILRMNAAPIPMMTNGKSNFLDFNISAIMAKSPSAVMMRNPFIVLFHPMHNISGAFFSEVVQWRRVNSHDDHRYAKRDKHSFIG